MMHNPVFEIIDDFDSSNRTTVAQAVTQQERAFNRTEFSNILLAVETHTRRLCVLKASKRADDEVDSVDNQRALENEAEILQQLSRPGHKHLVELLPVTASEFIAKDRDTGVYFLAEPYFAGYTLADLVNPLPIWEELGQLALRWLNYRLLLFTIRLGRHPSSRKLLPWFLPIDDRALMPSNKIDSIGKPLPVSDALEIAANLADLLAYLHERDIVHCDLKPSNVLYKKIQWPGWRDHRQLVVVDFGAAVKSGEAATAGTLRWSPPEQRSSPATFAMDLYAVGKILAYLLSGQMPPAPDPDQKSEQPQQHAGLATSPARPSQSEKRLRFPWYLSRKERAACTEKIGLLISDLLAENPSERPGSAQEVQHRLKEIQSMTAKRHSLTYLLMGVLVTIVVLFLASPGLRADVVTAAIGASPTNIAADLSQDATAGSAPIELSSPTDSSMLQGGEAQPAVPSTPNDLVTPTPIPWPEPTAGPLSSSMTEPTATATLTALPTATATAVVLQQPTRVAPSVLSVSIVSTGEDGLQQCLQEGADTFGRYQVKIRARLDGRIVRPQFEVQVQGGDLPEGRTLVGRQPVGALFSDLGTGEFQFDGPIVCESIGCNPGREYQWRLSVTDDVTGAKGESTWCNFKFEGNG